jgi:hypothetical protein
MKIKIFAHFNDLPGAFDLMGEQLTRASESGLLDAAETVMLCTNGQPDNFMGLQTAMNGYTQVKFIHTSNRVNLWEYPTLDLMKTNCEVADEDFAICYFHLKGLSRLGDQRVVDWRRFMEYWTIDQWEDSYAKIRDGFDLVATNMIEQPWLHSSGNFWWSKASYIKKLDRLVHPDNLPWNTASPYTGAVYDHGNFRYDHEAWVGSKNPVWHEMAHSPGKATPGWHFENTYPEENYVTAS